MFWGPWELCLGPRDLWQLPGERQNNGRTLQSHPRRNGLWIPWVLWVEAATVARCNHRANPRVQWSWVCWDYRSSSMDCFYSRVVFRWQILCGIVDAWAGPLAFGPSENRPRFNSNSTTRVVGLLEARWARSSCDDSERSWHLRSHRPVGSSATRPSHPRGWIIADSWMNSNAA